MENISWRIKTSEFLVEKDAQIGNIRTSASLICLIRYPPFFLFAIFLDEFSEHFIQPLKCVIGKKNARVFKNKTGWYEKGTGGKAHNFTARLSSLDFKFSFDPTPQIFNFVSITFQIHFRNFPFLYFFRQHCRLSNYSYTKMKCAVYILLTKIVGFDAREKCVCEIQYSCQSMKYFQKFLQTKAWNSCCCGPRIWCCNCQFSEVRPSKKDFIEMKYPLFLFNFAV